MIRRLLLGAALVLAGACAVPNSRPLDARWRPLERVVRDPTRRPGWFGTIVPTVFATNPDDLFDGSAQSDAVLVHEQLHAQRQLDSGNVQAWLNRYAQDPAFRTDEELLGWQVQIRWLVTHGTIPDPTSVAGLLTSYDPPLGLEFNAALAWTAAQITEDSK